MTKCLSGLFKHLRHTELAQVFTFSPKRKEWCGTSHSLSSFSSSLSVFLNFPSLHITHLSESFLVMLYQQTLELKLPKYQDSDIIFDQELFQEFWYQIVMTKFFLNFIFLNINVETNFYTSKNTISSFHLFDSKFYFLKLTSSTEGIQF